MRRNIMTSAAMAVICLLVPAIAHGAIIHESATLGPTGLDPAPGIGMNPSAAFLGSRFSVDSTVQVGSVGGHFIGSGTIFAAIVPLSSATALPSGRPTSDPPDGLNALATAVINLPFPSAEVFAPLSLTLEPGHYALIFGTAEYGTAGSGNMLANGVDIPGAASYFYAIQGEPDEGWHDFPYVGGVVFPSPPVEGGLRFVVSDTVIPEPATWLLAAVAVVFLQMRRKKSRTMSCELVAALALATHLTTPPAQAETLDGHTVTTRMWTVFPHGLPSPSATYESVVGPGTEIMSDFFLQDVDFSDTNILITNRFPGGLNGGVLYLSFQDTYAAIPRFTDITINPITNWTGFDSSRLSFGPNDIFLDLTGTGVLEGEQISLDITAIIPEPATWVIAAVASAYLGLRRRRSRRLPDKFLVGLPLATAIAIGELIAGPACAQSYRAAILNPAGSTYSLAFSNSESSQVGRGFDDHAVLWHGTAESVVDLHPLGFQHSEATGIKGNSQFGTAWNIAHPFQHAILWHGTAESAIDLHPAGFQTSNVLGVSGTSQVGDGDPIGPSHALLWHGTAESVVDLHPAGFATSHAAGVFEDTQVGSGNPIDGPSHALLWHGTAESVVDLHPEGFTSSAASAVSEGIQVGSGETLEGQRHALLWRGTAESAVDMHPAGYSSSFAEFSSGDSQVGFGFVDVEQHALLWHGTPESVVDLHPAGFDESRVSDVSGNRQVGSATTPNPGGTTGPQHAMLWTGTAESAVDLHLSLEGLGIAFRSSHATGIAENGDVVGWASDNSGLRLYVVLWRPVPEPSTGVLICCGLLAAACIHRRALLSTKARQPHSTAAGQRLNKLPALLCKSAFLCALFGWILIPSAASGALIVFDNEAAFLATADVVSTETFDEFPMQTLLGRPSATVDGVTYTAINPPPDDIPAPPWGWGWFAGPRLYFSEYRDLTVLSFGHEMVTGAIGFSIGGQGISFPIPEYTFTVLLGDGSQAVEHISGNGLFYRGFVAAQRIQSVTINTVTTTGSSHNFNIDDVSRGAIVPAIPEPTNFLMAALAGISFSVGKRPRL